MKLTPSAFLLCLALLYAPGASSGETVYDFMRAGNLRHFAKLIQWPAEAFESSTAPFVIGILEPDPFGQAFDSAIVGDSAHGRPLQLKRYSSVDDIGGCHILYVPPSRKDEYRKIKERLEGKFVAVVGEDHELLKLGGLLRFVNDDGRVKFILNVGAIERSRVRVGADIKQAAKKIVDEK